MSFHVLVIYSDAQSCAQYRLIEPLSNLKSDIEFKFSKNLGDAFYGEYKLWADAVIFQRPVDSLQLRFIKEFQASGRPVIIEIDDDLNNVPFSNPVHSITSGEAGRIYEACLKEAKYIHVSTPELKKSDKYTVFLNALNLKKYDLT